MRDQTYFEETEQLEAASASPWRARAGAGLGAAISAALLIGLVVWSYRLGVRDAADVPVIRAVAGATKEKPEDRGGLRVEHQDMAVFDALAPTAPEAPPGGAAIALAPPPDALSEEDASAAALEARAQSEAALRAREDAAAADAAARAAQEAEAARAAAAAVAAAAASEAETAEAAAANAGEDAAGADAVALSILDELRARGDAADAPAAAPTVAALVSPTARAPSAMETPRRRPARAASALGVAAPAPASAPAAAAPAPTPIVLSAAPADAGVQIQLGAFPEVATVEQEWRRLIGRNGDLLAGRSAVISPVSSGGRTLHRLRVGPFASGAEASALCDAIRARGEVCIVAPSG